MAPSHLGPRKVSFTEWLMPCCLDSLDDHARSKVKILLDNLQQLFVRLGTSSIRVNIDSQGLSNTNGIGNLECNSHVIPVPYMSI